MTLGPVDSCRTLESKGRLRLYHEGRPRMDILFAVPCTRALIFVNDHHSCLFHAPKKCVVHIGNEGFFEKKSHLHLLHRLTSVTTLSILHVVA